MTFVLQLFVSQIPLISGLIFDKDTECRGYISPYMTDRTFNRTNWKSYKFALEKNHIDVNIFSSYETQPLLYQEFFNQLIQNCIRTGFITTDFCPNNTAVNNNKMYLIDLEDVQPFSKIQHPIIKKIFINYNPTDYQEKIIGIIKKIKLFVPLYNTSNKAK